MAEVLKKSLVLTFQTAKGKEIGLTINAPQNGLEREAVNEAMDKIVAANAYGHGDIASKKASAKYVIQEVEPIQL